jgi:GntR family transcriptional regulator, arabinose operon transcriptional repressor
MKLTSKQILKELRIRIGKLKTDDRFLSEAVLCAEFNISRMTANKINNQLVNEGFLYRVKGSGSYIKTPQAPQQAIRVLLPCPDYFLFDCTYDIRLLLAGMMEKSKLTDMRIQAVPVSKVNNPQKIDWDELEDFNSETIVIVGGFWFKEIFPFLRKRKCKVIFCDFQANTETDYPKYFSNWTILRLDAHKEMSETVQTLAADGFKRIGYVFDNYFQDHPLNTGFKTGLRKAGIKFTPEQAIYSGNSDDFFNAVQDASKNFDVLLLSSPSLVRQTLLILQSSGQKVPDDIALISFGDSQNLSKLAPPVSAVAIPFFQMGQGIIELLQNDKLSEFSNEFKSQRFVRESLKTGAGKNINPACVLDISDQKTKQFSFYSK